MNPDTTRPVAEAASRLLADSYTLYLKTHNFHWNVTGPMFSTLHALFEVHYTELALAVDEIAERIRSVGHRAPGSYAEFSALATVKDAQGEPKALDMVRELEADLQHVIASAKDLLETAEAAGEAGRFVAHGVRWLASCDLLPAWLSYVDDVLQVRRLDVKSEA